MLGLGGLATGQAEASAAVERALATGAAAERFARMVVALGGPGDLLVAVRPARPGVVTFMDARLLGLAVVALGGGRRHAEDTVDPAVGLSDVAGLGAAVGADQPLAVVHARSLADAEEAASTIRDAMIVGDGSPTPARPAVLRHVGPSA
jgi:thymidine phosphorylase